ncbi:MAG: cytochrome c-type biogenesis CcmF C-terminal domain-containing protein [Anaerolineae bacterium]|nr:cytochrome c-type biogenesis CcmF C-terminal domain-containing protein [Anaerolineae bacterium]
MIAEIGLAALAFAFAASIYSILVSIYGEIQQSSGAMISGRNAALATLPLLLIAMLALLVALVTEQYQLSYVWNVSNPQTPIFYRITALWGSQKGSLLFWCFTTSLFTFGAIVFNWRSERHLMPYAIAVMMATQAFFIGITLILENPFARWWVDAITGDAFESILIPSNAIIPDALRLAESAKGLSPLLRHFGMIIHPPMLYLGFVGFLVPFAFAIAALASGDLSTNWIKASRRWSLISWVFLSLGLILGGRWAYDVLGWGGYWGWDPVENAAFLPWLVGTAFIHSVMIQQKRGMLKVWNMVLVIGTFSAVIFGTFATRSGVISSVHSFARSSVGFPMLTFWGAMTLIGAVLTFHRWRRGELRDEHEFAGLLSREMLFVLNNIIFMALTIAIFWGSFGAPITSELFFGTEITLGKDYFMGVTPPLFAALYILMGIAPLAAWSSTSIKRLGKALLIPSILTVITLLLLMVIAPSYSDPVRFNLAGSDSGFFLPAQAVAAFSYAIILLAGFVAIYETYRGTAARVRARNESWLKATITLFGRNQRRYGGYLVHLGIVIIGIGVIGSTLFQYQTRRTLDLGETTTVQNYQLRFDDFQQGAAADGRFINRATLSLSQNNRIIATIQPRVDEYPQMGMMIAGAHSTAARDFYVLLDGFDETGSSVSFAIYINPLINLVWWGGIVLVFGTLIAAWPKEVLPAHLRGAKQKMSGTNDVE